MSYIEKTSLVYHFLEKSLLRPPPAMKNQDTGHFFLNNEYELPESRAVIEKGVVWDYSNNEEQESIQATGPLKYEVLLMVSASARARTSRSSRIATV